MPAKYVLRHLHLPNITPFSHASTIQNTLVSRLLEHKALLSSPTPPLPRPTRPLPTVLTFTPTPTYTLGRREANLLSEAEKAKIEYGPIDSKAPKATVVQTLRGGQITFHGPNQLVIYPILDIKAIRSLRWPSGLTARCYVNVLEEATIRMLAGNGEYKLGIKGIRTENPGVWVDERTKIAALGVHLRRNVASFGVGLNVATDLGWFDRIVPCGLEGTRMTSIKEQLDLDTRNMRARPSLNLEDVSKLWTLEFAKCLWGDEAIMRKEVEVQTVVPGDDIDLFEGLSAELGASDREAN